MKKKIIKSKVIKSKVIKSKVYFDEAISFRILKSDRRRIKQALKAYRDIFEDESMFIRSSIRRFLDFLENNPNFFDKDPFQTKYDDHQKERRQK